MTHAITLLFGWMTDILFGDPAWLPHPVVGFGKWIGFWEKRLNKGYYRMFKGAILAVVSITLTFTLTWLLFSQIYILHYTFYIIASAIMVFFCLAGHTLRYEVRHVFLALERSLDDGRRQVARIVGRDTTQLSAQEVRTAALETLAENLSDGVVAPVFWFVLLGVPGMVAYKMVNTLDSMIGYRTERYREFGCWAARIDDVANYIPARLTAILMMVAGWIVMLFSSSKDKSQKSLLQHAAFVWRYGSCHASPNSGWPEAALASVLNCRFGGTHTYFGQVFEKPYIGSNSRELSSADMTISFRTCFLAECVAVGTASLLLLCNHNIDTISSCLQRIMDLL
ncbi:MAG: cobalamin biosynthesis protein CobD [Bacteroidaceae bacterium]|nr:cobalamin biosynthesis protein CobD [Bacteroidaceae bacterium]